MKKRILPLLLAALLLVSVTGVPVVAADGGVTLKLHYHREDGNYDGWDVWFWIDQGAAYPFAEEDGEMVATYTFKPGATKIGYIVRFGGDGWSGKDVNADQFIEVAGILSGTIHAYVESGVPGQELVMGDDVQSGVMVTSAKYDGDLTVTATTSSSINVTASTFTLVGNGTTVAVAKAETRNGVYHLTLAEPLDLSSSYVITLNDKEYEVTMPDYYATAAFETAYTYAGDDLGAVYTPEKTTLRVWAPTAKEVWACLYTDGDPAAQPSPVEEVPMTAGVNGTWVCELPGDRNGTYYTYRVVLDGAVNEACDPYARTTGVNGHRAMILDLDATDPAGWEDDAPPQAGLAPTDAVIWELHVRDLSIDESSGIVNKGKYLGVIEAGTRSPAGISTGLDHMKELGITHVHLLPVYDYGSVDESRLDDPQFNWGYDPVNYNVPEGSYSTDPYHGEVRVKEFKEMVKGLHDAGIGVIMDVVYNHVQNSSEFCVNKLVPGYFSRPDSNGSGCGNDTASERSMVSKYIVDSVKYWADEYHIDGFRFDLVGLIDTDTVNAIVAEVRKDHPDVIFYGEGWTMSTNVTKPGYPMATQTNSSQTPGFAYFSDNMRDMLKGSVFDQAPGFVSGASGKEMSLIQCFTAKPGWTSDPTQIVNYASCHDNNTLIDRITISTPDASRADQVRMNDLAAAIYMTAQGIPFMQAGEEMLRSKPLPGGGYEHNSYSSPDSVNSIKWDDLADPEHRAVFEYYKGLIAFRKAHPALRLTTADAVAAAVSSVEVNSPNAAAFLIDDGNEPAVFAVFNANTGALAVDLPDGSWDVCIDGEKAGTEVLRSVSGKVDVAPISALVLVRNGDAPAAEEPAPGSSAQPAPTPAPQPDAGADSGSGGSFVPYAVGAGVLAGGLGVAIARKNGKKKDD